MIKQWKDEVSLCLTKAAAIQKKYEGKAGEMEQSDRDEWTGLLDRADALKAQIATAEKQENLERWANGTANPLSTDGGREGDQRNDKGGKQDDPEAEKKTARRQAFRKFLVGGINKLNRDEEAILLAYQADNPAGGGFIVTPMEFATDIITLMKDLCFVRGLATNYMLDRAESLGIPSLDTDPSDADWTTELATGNEDTSMVFGRRELKPNPIAKLVKLSKKLLRQQAIDVEALVRDRLAYKFAVTEEKAFLTGDGQGKPLGLFTADNNGISTGRDVTAANSNSIVADDYLNVIYSLKAQYQARAAWLLHRNTVLAARKLKDNNGNYIWATGLGPGTAYNGQPELLLGRPIYMSEYAPSTISTGKYTAVLGDYNKYAIATALNMEVQVLDQLYATTNQNGYIARMEVDGMPVLEEAFARLKQA